MLPLCNLEGIGVIPWSPLARGRLTRDWSEQSERSQTDEFAKGLFTRTTEEADRRVVEAVAKIGLERAVSIAQIALAWILSKSEISAPIIGATKLHHLNDAVAALGIVLTATEMKALEINYIPHTVVGFS